MSNLVVGEQAPDFNVESTDGQMISLKDMAGKWLVLYFYPKDDTPGCTTEACNFRDRVGDYAKAGALIYGVSADNITSHHKFIKKHGLPFPLLADVEKTMVTDYGVWKEKSMYGKKYMGIERSTFLIDQKGKIAKIWPKVKVDNHHQEVLDFINSQS